MLVQAAQSRGRVAKEAGMNPWVKLGRFSSIPNAPQWLWAKINDGKIVILGTDDETLDKSKWDFGGWSLEYAQKRGRERSADTITRNWKDAVRFTRKRKKWIRLAVRVHAYRMRIAGESNG